MDSIFKLGVMVSVIDKLTGPVRRMIGSVQGLQKTMERGQGMAEFGRQTAVNGALMMASAEKMGKAIFGIIDPFERVQDAAAPLETMITSTMGSTQKSMEASKRAAIDWMKKYNQSADEFLRTEYMMASAGLDDVKAIAGTRTALALATATMGTNTDAAELLATVYNNMGDRTRDANAEMTRLGDVLAKTQQYFQFANLGVLTESMKYAIPAAIQGRMSIEQLSVVVGQLNNAGLKGSMAGTAFTASMMQMSKASKDLGFRIARTKDGGVDFIGTIDNITKKYGDLSKASDGVQIKFQQAFGVEGLRSITLLQAKTGDMKKALDGVKNSAGTVEAAQKIMGATATKQWQKILNNIDAVKIDLAEKFMPSITQAIPKILELVTSFGNFAQSHPKLMRTILLIGALGAATLGILAPILTVASGFLMVAGYGLQGVSYLGRGLLWLGKLLGGEKLLGAIRALGLGVYNFGRQALITAVTKLPALIASVWSFTAALLANPITWIILGIVALGVALYALYRNWDVVTAFLGRTWQWLGGVFAAGRDWLLGIVGSIANFFREYGLYILAAFMPVIGIPLLIYSKWSTIGPMIGQALTGALDWIKGLFGVFRESGAALWEAFVGGLESVISRPVEVVKRGLQWVRNLLPFSDAKEGPLSALTKSGSALVETFAGGVQRAMPGLAGVVADGLSGAQLALSAPIVAPAPVLPAAPAVDLAGLLGPRLPGQAPQGPSGQRPLLIQGDVHLHVEKMDSPGDFFKVLRRLAEEMA